MSVLTTVVGAIKQHEEQENAKKFEPEAKWKPGSDAKFDVGYGWMEYLGSLAEAKTMENRK